MDNILKGYFNKELSYIKNSEILIMTEKAINHLPEYFFSVASSSSGKYHPSFSLGEGGLYRHTKFAVEIAVNLFNIMEFTQDEKDCIVSSLILHDGFKQGRISKGHTDKLHPIICGNELDKLWKNYNNLYKDIIINAIASHMGKFNEKGKLPTPITKIEKFVHTCDYLSSRKLYDEYYKTNN